MYSATYKTSLVPVIFFKKNLDKNLGNYERTMETLDAAKCNIETKVTMIILKFPKGLSKKNLNGSCQTDMYQYKG